MIVVLKAPVQVAWLPTKVRFPAPTATWIVKQTFRIARDSDALPVDASPVTGDMFVDDDPEKLLQYGSDFASFKPRADLLLLGHTYAPGLDTMAVTFRVGNWSKRLVVLGRGQPVMKMPLTYERAAGGKKNPLGIPQPNIVRPDDIASDHPEVAGFGPIPMTWPQRMSKCGSYGKKWLKERWPWFAEDMDWTFWNAAPEDQQVPYLRGDEELYFENLHPKHPQLSSKLPGLRVRCFLHDAFEGKMRLREVSMNLDTLTAEPDQERVHLVWRGVADVLSDKLKEIAQVLVVTEELKKASLPVEHYRKMLEAKIAERNAEIVEIAPPAAIRPARQAPSLRERVARKESFAGEDLTGVDLSGADLSGLNFKETVLAYANLSGVKASGADFTEAVLGNANLAGADLSGAKLIGADLQATNLEKVSLAKAALEKCDLTGVNLRDANLTEANASRAKLEFADLSGAELCGAKLEQARLSDSRVEKTDFSKANLMAAQLLRIWGAAKFEGANLTNARFNHAFLTGANFRKIVAPRSLWEYARLQAADFTGADLLRAEFSNAFLEKARFTGALLKHARLCEASLQWGHVDGADLFQANLRDADLSEADCRLANFFEAEFLGAHTERTLLQNANLKRTKLV